MVQIVARVSKAGKLSSACVVLSLLLLAGCAVPVTTATLKVEVEILDKLTKYETAYVLQPGDVIEVFVYRHPDFSRKAVVRPDGFISLPLLGEIRVTGKSPRELNEHLTELYSVRLKSPEVTVIVENTQEPMVYVLGEVGAPKSLPIRQARTVAQALTQAGNATKAGSLSSVAIIRVNKNGELESHTVKTEGYNQPEIYMALQNMALMANDLVLVPESYRGQLMRAVTDVNTLFAPYFQFRLLQEITKQ